MNKQFILLLASCCLVIPVSSLSKQKSASINALYNKTSVSRSEISGASTINVSFNNETYDTVEDVLSAKTINNVAKSLELSNGEKIVSYDYDDKRFQSSNDLVNYIATLGNKQTYDINISTVSLEMNELPTFRTIVGSSGLRFTGRVKGDVSEYGMLTTKYNYINSLDEFKLGMEESKCRKVSSLDANFNYAVKNGYNEFSTVIANLKADSMTQSYIARVYAKVDYSNGDTGIFYSDLDNSYYAMPFEAGLVALNNLKQLEIEHPDEKTELELKRAYLQALVDPVCNIDNSGHLLGNGRSYEVSPTNEQGKYKITKLTDDFEISSIQKVLVNGNEVPFTINEDILSVNTIYTTPIRLNNLNGAVIDLYNSKVREYLNLEDDDEEAAFLEANDHKGYEYQLGTLSWNAINGNVDNYILYVSEDRTFTDTFRFITQETSVNPGCLIPDRTYYYKVVAIDDNKVITQSDVDTFETIDDLTLRQVNISGVKNVRDEGGWTTESGKSVNYGLLYRGGCLNGGNASSLINSSGRDMANNNLKITTEIDLRKESGAGGSDGTTQMTNYFDENKPFVRAGFQQFICCIPTNYHDKTKDSKTYDKTCVDAFKSIFATLSDRSNYPAYFHCNQGADRTGTVAYLLLGLLGVSYKDLIKDFELTALSSIGNKRWRSNIVDHKFTDDGIVTLTSNIICFGYFHDLIMQYYGTGDGKVSSAIENYLLTQIGVPQEHIDAFKDIMLS